MDAVSRELEHKMKGAESKALKRELGLPEAAAMVIGMVIGSGIFFKASKVFGAAGTPMLGILAWIVGGVITVASALTITEIATAIPKTGGVFAYLKELYNEKWGFLYGWMQSLIYVPGVAAALSIVFVTQATYFIPMTDIQQKIFAVAIIFFLIGINVISTKLGGKVQFISTIAKLIPIALIIGVGLVKGTAGAGTALMSGASANAGTGTAVGLAGFGTAVLGTLWAYDGWVNVGNMSGELKNPGRDIPKAIIIGLSLVMAAYILINVALLNIMPMADIIASKKAASDAAVVIFGNSGAGFIAAGIMISIFGALNGYVMTGARVPYAMAEQGLFPMSKVFSKLNKKTGTPLNAFLFIGVIATLYVFSGSFDTLTNLVVFVGWIFFVMTTAGIFILRTKFKHLPKTYTVPFYPIVPIIGILGGVYILGSTLIADTTNAFMGIAITLSGLPVYWYLKRKQKSSESKAA